MTPSVADGVTVRLPLGWVEVDLASADPFAAYRPEVSTPDHSIVTAIAPVAAQLRQLCADADIVAAAFTAEIVPVPDRPEPGVLAACMTLAVSPPVRGLDEVRRDLAALDDAEVDIRTADLPAGMAVLVTGAVQTHAADPAGNRESLPVALWRYFVPIPGLHRLAVLSFLTPNTDAVTEFGVVFAAVANSLEFRVDC